MVFEYYNSGIYALADQKIFSLWTMINYVHWVPAADLPKKSDNKKTNFWYFQLQTNGKFAVFL